MILNDLLLYRLLADLVRELHTLLLEIFKMLTKILKKSSVSQCCGSGMFIQDPDFCPSRIPDPKQQQKRGVEKIGYHTFFRVTDFTKLNIILFLKCCRKKFGQIFKELLKFLSKNFH
jgi:hypothetical protein